MRWLCPLVLIGCAKAEPKPNPPPALTGDAGVVVAETGKPAYTKYCAPCHGADLKGYVADHAPSLINSTFLASATDLYIRQSILAGRPGTSMPAYGKQLGGPLDDAALDGIVAYIRAQGPAVQPLAVAGKGEAARGASVYNEYCKTCHGDSAVRGEALHLANVQFQKLATDSFIRYAIEKGRPGTKMLPFGSVLQPAQLDDVVAYVRALGTGVTTVTLLAAPTNKEPVTLNPTGANPVFKLRENRFVSVDDVAKALAAKQRMVIIDARPPSDWMRVHIDGAVSIPYHDMKRLDEVPKDVTAIAYCACPHHLSGIVVDEMVKRGYKKAYVLDEGINVWHTKKYPVVAAPGVVAPPAEAPQPPGPGDKLKVFGQ